MWFHQSVFLYLDDKFNKDRSRERLGFLVLRSHILNLMKNLGSILKRPVESNDRSIFIAVYIHKEDRARIVYLLKDATTVTLHA